MSLSYYEVLGVEVSASQGEIKKAYFRLMKVHHPDRHGQQDDPISRLINEAYETLGNPEKRRGYDNGRNSSNSTKAHTANTNHQQAKRTKPKGESKRKQERKTNDFRSRTTQRRRQQQKPKRPCTECGGRGKVPDNGRGGFYFSGLNLESTCTHCKGSGHEPEQVYLPPDRKYCHECNGFGKYKQDMGITVMWERCSHCKGKGLEPIPVTLPQGRTYCSDCNGYGEIKNNLGITQIWERCRRCEGKGLEPIPVSLPTGRKHCSRCKGFGRYAENDNGFGFSLGFEIWTRCRECRGTGIEPLPNERRRSYY